MDVELLLNLATALGVGLLIGAERGWSARERADREMVAGLRTFALAGLLGGLAAVAGREFGVGAWIALAVLLALMVIAGYLVDARRGDPGMTTELALLVTFLLGSLIESEGRLLAAAGGIGVALLLSLKARLNHALRRLSEEELGGMLKLLFISVVLLPALPHRGYGPWEVFNPYVIWWMVVLIAGIGFAAYVAIRLFGARYGLMATALLGGIVSSTAMTLTLSRLDSPTLRPALAAGLLAASGLMFPRMLLEVGVVNPELLPGLVAPLLTAAAVYAAGAAWYFFHATRSAAPEGEPPLKNPFELGPALRFAALLTLILFLVEAMRRAFGDAGVYLVSLLSGLADVDAITLSLAQNAQGDLAPEVATRGIFIAAFANSLVKAGMIVAVGGRELALRTVPVVGTGLLLGAVVLMLG